MSAIVPQPDTSRVSTAKKRAFFIRTAYHAHPNLHRLHARRGRLVSLKPPVKAFLVCGVLGMAPSRSGPEIVAHRGSSEEAPENTLAAFRLGFQEADACELDIHLSKDAQVVVMHDANTQRTAGVDKLIAQQTLGELQALDAGRWKGENFAGERIPLLSDVLALIPERKRLLIEIKCGPEVVPRLVSVIQEAERKPEQTALIAFSLETLRQAKSKLPNLQAYWLVG